MVTAVIKRRPGRKAAPLSVLGTLPAATPAQMARYQSTGQLIVAKAVR